MGSAPKDVRRRPRRRRAILVLLAAALAIDYADRSVVGALGPQLRHEFGLDNTELGLLASAFAIVAGVATVPAGMLTDRVRRMTLLTAATCLWAAAMVFGGAATSFAMLLISRVALGGLAAVARPAASSLVGDLYDQNMRSRALGWIDAGALIGTGAGVLIAASFGSLLTWRSVFWLLAGVGLVIGFGFRGQPEPARTGDQEERISLLTAARRVLATRTIVIVILSGAIGDFFFAGVRTFAVTFTVHRYDVRQFVADLMLLAVGAGGLLGVLLGGRIGDRVLESRSHSARVTVAAASFVVAAVLFAPALLMPSLTAAMPLYFAGSAALAFSTPVLDAIRVDVMPANLRGRSESVRTMVQIGLEAAAPLLFGVVADAIGGGHGRGLQLTFLIALGTLVASGLVLLPARRYYESETLAASSRRGGARPARRDQRAPRPARA